MKKFWNAVTLAGLSLVLLVLCAPSAKAQSTSPTLFGGTVNLPFQVQWGAMVLPAGEYTLRYGAINGSTYVVEVKGEEKGGPHGIILARNANPTDATANSLVCLRDGDAGIVRDLVMPAIGRSVSFGMPRGARLVATNHKDHTALVEAHLRIQRIPVALNAK